MSEAWTLTVLRAFRDQMNTGKPDGVPDAHIGWPHPGMHEGPYSPFVWFEQDQLVVRDGRTQHELVVVTGALVRNDPSRQNETELEQAIAVYEGMRVSIASVIDDLGSAFNAAFIGTAQPHPEAKGVRPSKTDDFDATSVIGERWLVIGSE